MLNEVGVNNIKYFEENRHRFLDDFQIALDVTRRENKKIYSIVRGFVL